MAQEDLISLADRTTEEQQTIARMGGVASGVARRKKKMMKEQIELLLSLPIKDEKAIKQMQAMGIDTNNIDNQMAMIIAQWRTAMKGGKAGVDAFNSLRDTIGEQPIAKQEFINDIPIVIRDDVKE